MTYAQLLARIEYSASELKKLDVFDRYDRVAIVMPNSPELAVMFLAASTVATCAILNPDDRARAFEFFFEDLDVKALIIDRNSRSPAGLIARKNRIPVFELDCGGPEAANEFIDGSFRADPEFTDNVDPADVSLILYTSGTTSKPKSVPLTHKALYTSAQNTCNSLGLGVRDRCLNVMPLFHVHGLVSAVVSSVHPASIPPGFLIGCVNMPRPGTRRRPRFIGPYWLWFRSIPRRQMATN